MTSHALTRRAPVTLTDAAPHGKRTKRVIEIAHVAVFNPHTLGALRCAMQLGVPLCCTLEGNTLVIRRADG